MQIQIHESLLRNIVKVIAISLSLYQLYVGYFGAPFSLIHRPLHVMAVFVILFLTTSTKGKRELFDKNVKKFSIFDIGIIVTIVIGLGYVITNAYYLQMVRVTYYSPVSVLQLILGLMVITVIIEAARRVIGLTLSIITVVFIIYALVGNMLPSPFWHRGFSLARIVEQVFLTEDGIWGIPVHVTSTYVYLFILFGSFLIKSGAGSFFTDVAFALTGNSPGGPAKSAVVASSFMGTISGSSVANVATTGAFTIPLMKKVKYKPHIAGAVEAVASTGGQIVPPIMGAAAFLMSEFTGIPYVRIMYHALLPAFLYYFAIFAYIHFESLKNGLVGLPKEQLPNLGKTLKERSYLLLPVIVVVTFLIKGYSPLIASFYANVSLVGILLIVNVYRKVGFAGFVRIVADSLEDGAHIIITVTVATACAGIIVGILLMTGLGSRMADIILTVSGGNIIFALILSMAMALILGMGMPTSSAYIIMAALLVPGLIAMGLEVIVAHMFVFYFACLSSITPPVALASYTAAAIAKADPTKTGWAAVKIGLIAFIVPYMFVYSPAILLIGPWTDVLWAVVTSSIGVVLLALAMNGYGGSHDLKFYERIVLVLCSALLLIQVGITTDLLGISTAIVFLYFRKRKYKKISQ